MSDLDTVLKLADSESAKLAEGFKKLLHTELQFGMSNYVCRYGTLSDGHEKITEAQRYYQAIKESYQRAQTLKEYKALALESEADLIDATEALEKAQTKSQELRAKASLIKATAKLESALVMAEDCKRQLDAFLKVASELQESVRAKYPEGIEQAELDNWKAVTEYRSMQQEIKGTSLHLEHLPLPQELKATLGVKYGKPELTAWFVAEKKIEDKTPSGILTALNEKPKTTLELVK